MESYITIFDAIAYINMMYSFIEAALVSDKVYDECELHNINCGLFSNSNLNISAEYWMWKSVYIVNIIVNLLVSLRSFIDGDRYPILIWYAYTLPLFIIRVTCTPYHRINRVLLIFSCFINGN